MFHKGNEIEVLLTNLNNHVEHIRYLTQVDLRIFGGYIALQLAFAGWLIKNPVQGVSLMVGLIVIDVTISIIAATVLYFNYKRREEIVNTLENINQALGLNVEGAYIEGITINAKNIVFAQKGFNPWLWLYLVGIGSINIGVILVLIKP